MTTDTLDPVYCGTRYSAHYGTENRYARRDATDVCEKCGATLAAVTTYSGQAEIVSANNQGATAMVSRSDLSEPMDPLLSLANAIGARMPFTVHAIRTDTEDYDRRPTLVGSFHGGDIISVAVKVGSSISWVATSAPDPEQVASNDD